MAQKLLSSTAPLSCGGKIFVAFAPNTIEHYNSTMKEKIRRKVPEGELCAVCSDLATGYHYGVASCNGCKTFFRRTIVSDHSFVCQYQGNCDVNKNIRCACRHCRFNKCVAVGMDAKAIQNDRDRIGPTKKMKVQKRPSSEEEWVSMSPQRPFDDKVIEHLRGTENLCNQLRSRMLPQVESVRQVISATSLIFSLNDLRIDPQTICNEHYPASMIDIQMWNKRELRLCLEWVKTFEEFQTLNLHDQLALVHNFAFTFNILNRVYYSQDAGPDKIVYPNGAYILRQPQEQVRIPGCRSIYHRQMDEIMIPFRTLDIDIVEFAAFKASIFFNPDAMDLSPEAKITVGNERMKYLAALFHMITSKIGITAGAQRYGTLLMMTASIQNIIAQNDENMQVMEVFQSSWRIDRFVKELCMKVP